MNKGKRQAKRRGSQRVAFVTGASRGIGAGIARELDEAGYRVFGTGRTIAQSQLPLGITRITCDHTADDQTDSAFDVVAKECGRLDVLVNAAWDGYAEMVTDGRFSWPDPFWLQPRWRWERMVTVGARTTFVASQRAAALMVPARSGLIVNLSYWAAQKHVGNALYGVAKAATDKLTADCAAELREHNVAVVSMYPGLVRTEAVLAAGVFDLSNSESPEYQGRAVAALADDPGVLRWTGRVVRTAELGGHYGFTDIDGAKPRPLTIGEV